jgi:hypothetical protein
MTPQFGTKPILWPTEKHIKASKVSPQIYGIFPNIFTNFIAFSTQLKLTGSFPELFDLFKDVCHKRGFFLFSNLEFQKNDERIKFRGIFRMWFSNFHWFLYPMKKGHLILRGFWSLKYVYTTLEVTLLRFNIFYIYVGSAIHFNTSIFI